MTLTKEEIEMIKREAFDLYPERTGMPTTEGVNTIRRIAHAKAATKYLLQLKEERERAGKLLEALEEVKNHCQEGSWFEKTCTKAINEYKNQSS